MRTNDENGGDAAAYINLLYWFGRSRLALPEEARKLESREMVTHYSVNGQLMDFDGRHDKADQGLDAEVEPILEEARLQPQTRRRQNPKDG